MNVPVDITTEMIAEHGLSDAEYRLVVEILGRKPNILELGIFSVMWSEHCSYKSSKKHLGKFPTQAPWVVCGPGENAGVVDIGEGKVAIFKMESHNHPSFIEPCQGAATGVGGILRDVFTMGARPVAMLNALRFGEPRHPKTRHLVSGVVSGIGGYGNCVGVPTVAGECTFDAAYNGNILVNAMCVGVADADKVFYASASGIGNPVIYVGAKTGRDGIHGATMASAEFSEESEARRPTVQVGDPFTEKLLIEACLELMEKDCIVAIQDMGAAGLTSSSFEMASRGACGIEMNLSAVPLREEDMTPYEIMLSESQERMLMVLEKGRESEAHAVFEKWGLAFASVGTVTDTGRMVLLWEGKVVADVPIAPVSGASPVYDRPHEPTRPRVPVYADDRMMHGAIQNSLLMLMGSPDMASKRWIWEQYDHMVMGDTVQCPGGDAAVIRLHGSNRGLAVTCDCTPRYCEADPFEGGKQAVAEAWRNLTAVGARPLAITNCLNFGNPERPHIMGQLVGCIDGMAEACRVLDFPVVSGNVSLYNETDGAAILPTPDVGGVGLIDDLGFMTGIAFDDEGLQLILVGTGGHWIGASVFWRVVAGRNNGAPPPLRLAEERRHGHFVRDMIRNRRVRACHDLSDGGLAVAAAEMCLASGIGANIAIPTDVPSINGWLFGEDQARYLLAVDGVTRDEVLWAARKAGVIARVVGETGGDGLTLGQTDAIPLDRLREAHEGWMPAFMGRQRR
ncbi:MAG: phosphoribosylformylglycinamidine synthase subunit PurL [Geminicoccaceae bacterium]|nr:phosphoribosylformylglycinamidine synthase subunit PurL [Geminicoccaceae bacterium]